MLIECRDRSHPTKVVKVATFKRTEAGWVPSLVYSYSTRAWTNDVEQVIDSRDVPIDDRRFDHHTDLRTRAAMRCRLCGFSVVARMENLEPLLDRADAAGVTSLPLSTLSAILKKQ